jgi:tryptophan 2,3-dioxygenase
MTPPEYSAIRPYLKASSGFQSWQYRCIEFMMGNKNAAMLKPHGHRADRLQVVEQAWLQVYREPDAYWELYQLGEELVDLEDAFRLWRFRHVTTVERVIGFKKGTGGTSGVAYLRKMLDVVLFPELWRLRTDL